MPVYPEYHPMPLTIEEVTHIARLARLNLTPGELERYREQLSAILDHVAQLAELDTTGIDPTTGVRTDDEHLRDDEHVRDDEPRPGLDPAQLAENAPDWLDDHFKVPPIFE